MLRVNKDLLIPPSEASLRLRHPQNPSILLIW
jgi:hypothetical protein